MTGFIGVGQLRYILTNLGEKMSDEEVDELLKTVDTSSGEINYTGESRSAQATYAILENLLTDKLCAQILSEPFLQTERPFDIALEAVKSGKE